MFKKILAKKSNFILKKREIREVIDIFENNKNKNLNYLVKKRFEWMQNFISYEDIGIEVGAAVGFSKYFLKCKKLEISDCTNEKHLDLKNINAQKTNLKSNTYDFIVASNMLHHLSSPILFIREMNRILKKNGKLIIFEPNLSAIYQIITFITKHEGFDFAKDVWDENISQKNNDDPWDSNQAVQHMLFDDKERFYKETNNIFRIIHDDYSECLIFLNSGGIYSKSFYISMNNFFLKICDFIDKILIKLSPDLFALGRKIVLVKN